MSLFSPPAFRNALSVGADHRDRYAAVQDLLRPDEVDVLFRAPTVADWFTPFPERVGAWLKGAFATGALAYAADRPGADIWQSPGYTLRRGAGDCEDFAMLALSVFQHERVPAVMITGALNGVGHAWVEGVDASGGFLMEATDGRVFRGLRPPAYAAETAFGGNFYRRMAA